MKKSFFLAPSGRNVGLTSVSLGLVRGLDQEGLKVGFVKPVAQYADKNSCEDPSVSFIKAISNTNIPTPIILADAQEQLAQGDSDQLMEKVVDLCQQVAKDVDVLVVEGLVNQDNSPFIATINSKIISTLDSRIILVASQNTLENDELNRHITMTANYYGGTSRSRLLGCILNKVKPSNNVSSDVNDDLTFSDVDANTFSVFADPNFRCLGYVPWDAELVAPRAKDILSHLSARSLNDKADLERRIKNITICARTLTNSLASFKANTLIVVPGDRDDMILGTCMAAANGIPIAGLLLTGGLIPKQEMLNLCATAFESGLPLLSVEQNTIETAYALDRMNYDVPSDDIPRIERVMNFVADHIDKKWLANNTLLERQARLSPAAFRQQLVERASRNQKRIVLPEGEEPRTLRAAIFCHNKSIAQCVLIGNPEKIHEIAEKNSLELPDGISIVDPSNNHTHYIDALVDMRKHKGLTATLAESQLEDSVVLGTVMLALDEVDGLVSGAINTTANTIRPALQLIKTKPGARLVSSVFFMCLPDQVLVYGDCAVNPNPSAEELADIAIQSGDSAASFGIEPRIAMISYSSGESGMGVDVNKVRKATQLAKEMRPDLLIDGPLQYDAAFDPKVAAQKVPNSPVAGNATVFIFPDLNTGNTTYKAVQRSANVVSIGPMLQGMKKPVNDLSRGASVEDIIYTIALTAVQASTKEMDTE